MSRVRVPSSTPIKNPGFPCEFQGFSLSGSNNPLAFAAKDQGPLLVEAKSCSGKNFFAARLDSAILTNLAGLGFPLKNTRKL